MTALGDWCTAQIPHLRAKAEASGKVLYTCHYILRGSGHHGSRPAVYILCPNPISILPTLAKVNYSNSKYGFLMLGVAIWRIPASTQVPGALHGVRCFVQQMFLVPVPLRMPLLQALL